MEQPITPPPITTASGEFRISSFDGQEAPALRTRRVPGVAPVLRHPHLSPVALVQLDSHSDTIDSYFGMPHTHGTPFYHAVNEGLIDTAHSTQVGLRGGMYSARDHEVPREMGMQVITGVEAHELGMAAVAKRAVERAGDAKGVLSIDIDLIDPAYAPATGTPEIGGLAALESPAFLRPLP